MSGPAFKNLVCHRCFQPHCHWCGRELSLRQNQATHRGVTNTQLPESTTRDHVPYKSHPDVRLVLACHACNSVRGQSLTNWVAFHDREQADLRRQEQPLPSVWPYLLAVLVGVLLTREVRRWIR